MQVLNKALTKATKDRDTAIMKAIKFLKTRTVTVDSFSVPIFIEDNRKKGDYAGEECVPFYCESGRYELPQVSHLQSSQRVGLF